MSGQSFIRKSGPLRTMWCRMLSRSLSVSCRKYSFPIMHLTGNEMDGTGTTSFSSLQTLSVRFPDYYIGLGSKCWALGMWTFCYFGYRLELFSLLIWALGHCARLIVGSLWDVFTCISHRGIKFLISANKLWTYRLVIPSMCRMCCIWRNREIHSQSMTNLQLGQ